MKAQDDIDRLIRMNANLKEKAMTNFQEGFKAERASVLALLDAKIATTFIFENDCGKVLRELRDSIAGLEGASPSSAEIEKEVE